VTQAIF